jgi:CHAT domain-containing protein/lipopolysaccharide biosynthesis regulator YciM
MKRRGSRIERLIAQGDELLREGDVDGAEFVYRRAWNADRRSADAAWSLGCVASHRGDWDESLDWAHQALKIDPRHLGALGLAGNALVALERHTEAIAHLEIAGAAGSEMALAQLGLCYEALGRLPEAEATLRALLERDLTYQTRHATVAMYDQSPFWADVHHALARVLQGRGNLDEARLHYHLTKRIDPETVLDPRYLEIMSTEDLEDHPIDRLSTELGNPEEVSELSVEMVRLARAASYDEMVAAAASSDRDALLGHLAGVIEAAQVSGEFTLSAQLRVVIDVVGGADARDLHDALATSEWRRLLELAGKAASGRVSVSEATEAARAEGPPPFVSPLLGLVGRFVELEPRSGMVLAEVVVGALADLTEPGARADATRLLARAQLRCGDAIHAEASLKGALEIADDGADLEAVRAVLAELWIVQTQRNDLRGAEATVRRSVELAGRLGDRDRELAERDNLAVLLFRVGRTAEAHREALAVAEAAASGEGPADVAAHIARLVATTADATGAQLPDGLLDALRQRPDHEAQPLPNPRDAGLHAAEQGRLDEAVLLLERARDEAYASGTRRDLALALTALGETLAMADRDDEARSALEEGLRRAEPEGGAIDVWPALMALSAVCARLGDQERAVEAAERALAQAERTRDAVRKAASHEQLAHLLIEAQPDRAIHHFGRSLGSRGRAESEAPQAWTDGVTALQGGRYEAALDAFEALTMPGNPYRPAALANSARARIALGDSAGGLDALRRASAAFADAGDMRNALTVLGELAELRRSYGEAASDTLEPMRAMFEDLGQPNDRRAGGLVVGAAALEAHEHELAETALRESLALATSEEWADVDDEISARRLLGTLYRRTGRNAEAYDQYVAGIRRAVEVYDEQAEGELRGRLGIVLRQLGRLEDALAEYDRAIAIAVLYDAEGQVAVHKMNRASVLFELGRDEAAQASAVEAWRAFEDQGNSEFAARTLLMLRQNTAGAGLPADLAARLAELLGSDVHDDVADAVLLSERAMMRLRKGDVDGARADMTAVLELKRARGDSVEEVRALLNRARVMADHDGGGALADVRAAAALALSLDNVELQVDAIEARVDLALAAGELPAVVDGLCQLDRGWTVLRRRLSRDSDRVELAGRAARGLKRCAAVFINAGEDEAALAMLEQARARALGDLLTATTAEAGETWPDPLDINPGRALLDHMGPRAIAVGLDIVQGEVIATTLAATGQVQVRLTGISEAALERLLDDYRHEVITFRGRAAQTWTRQAAPLLACIADELDDAATVVLLPDGPLHELPLHAVPTPDQRLLIESARVVYAPSLHALAHMHSRASLAAADPATMIATVGVAFPDEARAIALRTGGPCLSGRRLDKEVVRDIATRSKVLHFACHGFFDGRTPLDSGLLLSTKMPPAASDVLSVRDVAAWDLRSDLVTLSACETGLGKVVPADFLGLARGFAGAGARSVIASLWPVDDAATQRLMLLFYDEIERQRRTTGHVDVARALRTAQLACADTPLQDWAAFKLIGWPEFEWGAGT